MGLSSVRNGEKWRLTFLKKSTSGTVKQFERDKGSEGKRSRWAEIDPGIENLLGLKVTDNAIS